LSSFSDIVGAIRIAGPSEREAIAVELLEEFAELYSRAARELVDDGHFSILHDLELCEFIGALRKDTIKEAIEEFLVHSASETSNQSGAESPVKDVHVLGGYIPEVYRSLRTEAENQNFICPMTGQLLRGTCYR
jgi:hypothetical protein